MSDTINRIARYLNLAGYPHVLLHELQELLHLILEPLADPESITTSRYQSQFQGFQI